MATRIITPASQQNAGSVLLSAGSACACTDANDTPCGCGNERDCGCRCERSVEFCETLTLHESFDASAITCTCANIAYDTSFLGYTVEPATVQATLPGGGCCPINVFMVSLTGAIPYIIDVGPVSSGCGCPVRLSLPGSVMVDESIGYTCGDAEPDLTELTCGSVTPHIHTEISDCGCSARTNITVHGSFCFTGLPTCQQAN